MSFGMINKREKGDTPEDESNLMRGGGECNFDMELCFDIYYYIHTWNKA